MIRGPALARVMAIALSLTAPAALAEEAVAVSGRLSDAEFYRLVSCAAPPGGDCARPAQRWLAERPIRVALRRIDPAYLGRRKLRAEAALTRALRELNRAEAGFHLARVSPDDLAEIEVLFLDIVPGSAFAGFAGLDGGPTATRLEVEPDSGLIRRATLVVNTTLKTEDFESTLLSDLTRAMGLTTAVAGPAYTGKSVLADTGPGPKSLAPQDIAALRRHYAAPAR